MEDIQIKVINNKVRLLNFISKHKRIIITFLLVFFYILLYFVIDFSTQSLVAHDEGLYARRSRLVEESSNWFSSPFLTPHHKTIGSYWFIALSIRLFGNSELALRLPSILASFLCLFSSYFIALKISNKQCALISVFSLSSMPLWIQYSRYASPDIPFVLCILFVILFFLKFLDSKRNISKYFNIFISGLFISTAFFIRSYMVLVPLIGLTPFLSYNLLRTKNIFKSFFLTGIFVGSLPIILSLYFSYNKFGEEGINSLFEFAKKQAIGGFNYINLVFIPLNYLYLTFPIGLLLIILFVYTKSNINIKYPLLFYVYPSLSLLILLLMSTSYPHYYLFLLPSLSNLFAVKLKYHSFRFSLSKKIIKNILFFFIILISCLLISLSFYFDNSLYGFSPKQKIFVYFVLILLLLSYVFSLRFVFDTRISSFNLVMFFFNIIIPQYLCISLLYNFGIIGSPNLITKSFIHDNIVSSIIKSNTIYLYSLDSKIQTLLLYYLPSSKVVNSSDNISRYKYVITSDREILNTMKGENRFKSIKEFNDHFFLMNISK